jgi:hypothetical protein
LWWKSPMLVWSFGTPSSSTDSINQLIKRLPSCSCPSSFHSFLSPEKVHKPEDWSTHIKIHHRPETIYSPYTKCRQHLSLTLNYKLQYWLKITGKILTLELQSLCLKCRKQHFNHTEAIKHSEEHRKNINYQTK